MLILAAQNTVSFARMEFLIRDRLSWMRFFGSEFGKATPDENTISAYRERLTGADVIRALFQQVDRRLRRDGYLSL